MSNRLRRLAAMVPALGLVAGGLAALGAATPAATPTAGYQPSANDYYINYAPPRIQSDTTLTEERVPDKGARRTLALAHSVDRKFAMGNPVAARVLAKHEREAIRTGQNPSDFYKRSKTTKKAKLLTLLIEFNDQANDDFSGWSHPKTINDVNDCVTEPPGTKLNGPLHNRIPDPALAAGGGKDNNTMWVPDFSTTHYNDMLYSSRGITKRVRTDLTDPRDGRKGIDLSGYTMKNMYEELSKGAYTVSGEAVGWIKVPHSEAWYAAGKCGTIPQDMSGHPDNPRGPGQLAIDAVNALAAQNPSFPWADYDKEDVSDYNGNGNYDEPDGVIDHLVLIHAGADKSGGGGAEGTFAIWAHSSSVAGGYTVPGTNVKISNYIVQPEDSGVGVFAHEYGHDLGLPDLYDTSGNGDSAVDFWDLMSSGSHAGPIIQAMPTHMGLWDKWVLGWADPKIVEPGGKKEMMVVGQTSNTPKGTEDGVRINLPDKHVVMSTPHSGANLWWSNNDQSWGDSKLTRTVDVPAAADAKFQWWSDWSIEQDWDFGFFEVSDDGGATWTEQKVYFDGGELASTGDDYDDPNKRLQDYGGKKYGMTGESGGWVHLYVDLAPFAGKSVQVRFRYATDAAAMERGWFNDDFSVTGGGATVWSDDVENGANGWTATKGTFTDTTGAGWVTHSGELKAAQYYLAEWRNLDGFDNGLQYTYDTSFMRDGAWKVERIKYNAPGLLVWYRDAARNNNNVSDPVFDLPSVGPKGQLLLVDSHFEPLRRTGAAAAKDGSVLKNLPSRPQSSNAAFNFFGTYPFKECIEGEPFTEYCTSFGKLPAVKTFTDAKGWYPGLEIRDGALYFRHRDASVVVPSKDNEPYTTRIVHPDGSPATELYGTDIGGPILGTGNPGDVGKQLGVQVELVSPLPNNKSALLYVTPAKK
ncbi:immune inhibitor A domain-containing protein [Sphaerimonospora cavernae]|uniref:Immune inhibitor A domain-containing protein n=1 Tax=Sphaerimonospora cavernae TaxID=1740611 RepID=A0ABV6U4G5_9ACTN